MPQVKTQRVVVPTPSRQMILIFYKWDARMGLVHTDNKSGSTNDRLLRFFRDAWDFELAPGMPSRYLLA